MGMSREEASFILANIDRRVCDDELNEALDMAIKALEQEPCDKCVYSTKDGYCQYDDITETIPPLEPCEDVISREDALMAITGEWTEPTDELIHRFIKRIKKLPPVNPQPKTGHWIHLAAGDVCSECGWSIGKYISPSKYCPDCGRRMVEPQESEK